MALFTINRYMGDEDGEVDDNKATQAQSILQKLNQQAKAKKDKARKSDDIKKLGKPKSKTKRDHTPASSSEEDRSVRPVKIPKRKRLKSRLSQSEEDTEEEATSAKKTKKTAKRGIISVDPVDSSDSEDEEKGEQTKKTKVNKLPKKRRKEQDTREEEEVPSNTTGGISKLRKKEKLKNRKFAVDASDKDEAKVSVKEIEEDKQSSSEEEGSEGAPQEDENVQDGPQNKEIGGFTVIGDVRKKKIEQVQRVLPDWLANPFLITNDLLDAAGGLDAVSGLDSHLIQTLADNGIKHLFPVQRLVIPVLLGGHKTGHLIGPAGYRPSDICCSAPTGSGKTLAFVLPIIQALQYRVVRQVRALIVLPVRDLALQVHKVFCSYVKGTNLKVGLLVGQKSFKTEQQNLIRKGPRGPQVTADIVVATPGRLVDHIKDTPGFNLHYLRYLVIDEADRMMDDIKQDWLSQVEQAVYGGDSARPQPALLSAASACKLEMPLQKLLFSATLSQNPEKLQQLNLFQPKLFTAVVDTTRPGSINPASTPDTTGETNTNTSTESKPKGEFVGKFSTPAGLTEYVVVARDVGEKALLVLYFLLQRKYRHVLVFTNSVDSTHRLYHLIRLVGGLKVQEFSSTLFAAQRTRTLKKFAAGKIDVLICSDAMARGMDVENVQCVISYDHAPYVKTYIHRIGRTARAGKAGTAITLLEKKEITTFKNMIREAGKEKVRELKITKGDLKCLLPDYQRALQQLPGVLEAEKQNR